MVFVSSKDAISLLKLSASWFYVLLGVDYQSEGLVARNGNTFDNEVRLSKYCLSLCLAGMRGSTNTKQT